MAMLFLQRFIKSVEFSALSFCLTEHQQRILADNGNECSRAKLLALSFFFADKFSLLEISHCFFAR